MHRRVKKRVVEKRGVKKRGVQKRGRMLRCASGSRDAASAHLTFWPTGRRYPQPYSTARAATGATRVARRDGASVAISVSTAAATTTMTSSTAGTTGSTIPGLP